MKIYGLKIGDKWLGVEDTRKDFNRYQLSTYDVRVPWFTDNYRMADEIAHHRGVGNSPNNPYMPEAFYMKIPRIVELEID